jgi:hypothetical protein
MTCNGLHGNISQKIGLFSLLLIVAVAVAVAAAADRSGRVV